jgi:hypothetical protein
MRRVVVLGPQRHVVTVTEELNLLGISGRIATITAGWQERESEDDELSAALGNRAVNLRLHARTDAVFAQDRELFAAHRRRQDSLRQLQDMYRMRLDHLMAAASVLMTRQGSAALIEPERQDTIEQLRGLDAHHLRRVGEIHDMFELQVRPAERRALAQHRAEVQGLLADCDAVAVAGGHVSTLIGRMRLLDVAAGMTDKPILAWSAGAMVLTDRVIAFHDRPPEGAGNPEVLDVGLGIAPGIIALPHATARLKLDDLTRMSLFSQRFSPSNCICLDAGHRARLNGRAWTFAGGTTRIDRDGKTVLAQSEVA